MLNVAIIGYGYWGPNLARNLGHADNAELVEITDASDERLAQAEVQFPQARLSKNPLVVFNNPNIDAVVIATPAGTHFELVKAALLHDKNVCVEKPLALAVEEGEELVALAQERKKVLMVDHTYEYHPAIRLIEGMIAEGELGRVLYATSARLNLGIIRKDVNVLWNLAPHDISIILRLFAEEPNRVEASGGTFLQKGVEDVVSISLEFPSGRVAQVYVSWLSPRKTRELTIVGEKKMVVFDETLPEGRVKVYDKGVDRQTEYESYGEYLTLRHGDIYCPQVPSKEPLRMAVEDFIHAVQTGEPPRSDGETALKILRVLASAQASLDRRRS